MPNNKSDIKIDTLNETSGGISDRYVPQDVETRIYSKWENEGSFKAADSSQKPPYSIILPPPNVTGHLHLGHALDHTIQDVLIRWRRMSGYNALWLPGTDHAGIATQSVVERELKKEGLSRLEMGREKFLEKVWEWRDKYGDRIYDQMKRLGDSVDWDRKTFTLDPGVSTAVKKVFVHLYKKGLIYKGLRLVNWSSPLQTAISDLEVEYKEQKGSIWHIKYQVEGTSDHLVVATTRPETLLGDTAVCVHPTDERYKDLIGKNVILPLVGKAIPVIADDYVDPEFGSGVVKITPAHDFNDYQVGQRHNLPIINLLNKDGTLNENGLEFKGLKVQEARKQVLEKLEAGGFIEKIEPHKNKVGYCSRSGAVVEPFLSEQWFMRMSDLANPARQAVEQGKLKFEPESWSKVYLHWMNIIEDWCISRQLWWGHRIPAWHCKKCEHITVSESVITACEKCQSTDLRQDEDVLDTWFSSGLWPFSTMGWPAENNDVLKSFYPTSVLVTGHDIIFFWVSRMIMLGIEFAEDIPFETVYIHGLIRDSDGKKMSKSLGNSIDPIEMIDKYGADALRFTLMTSLSPGRDIKFSEKRLEGYRNFMNKIWNATRFALTALQDFDAKAALPGPSNMSIADQWIIQTTADVEKAVHEDLQHFRFQEASNRLYQFVWKDICDWYLEFVKPIIYGAKSDERSATQMVLAQTLNRMMRLLHPFAPFITEELYAKLPIHSSSLILEEYPTIQNDSIWLSLGSVHAKLQMEMVKEVITAVRTIRGESQIKPNQDITVRLAANDYEAQKILKSNQAEIMRLGRISNLEIGDVQLLHKSAVATIKVENFLVDVVIPLEGLIDFEAEIKRLQKSLEKTQKDEALLERRLSDSKYLQNAPEELVEADKAQLDFIKNEITKMSGQLIRLA